MAGSNTHAATKEMEALQVGQNQETKEVRRIRNEHPDDPFVISKYRVKGSLKVTRAFGAGFLKQINMDVAEGPIEDDAGQIVDLEQDDYRKRADEDVKSIVLNTQMKASSRHNKPKKSNNAKVLPQDYECTKEDADIIEYMKATPENRVLVNIDNNWVNRDDMDCLFRDGEQVNGAVLSAYIHCIRHEEHLQHREGGDVYLENTFISSLLKRDGDPKVALNYKDDVDYTRVEKYLHADMVFLPINIEKFHWYLAVVNAKKYEIHVLDSFGRELSDRRDLKTTLRGLERLIKLAAEHTQLYRDKWADIKVTSWPIIDKITERMQTDGVSCGLWMINYMEYWTGITLSDHVTQDDISKFRFKLPAILWNSTLNTARGYQDDEQDKEVSDNPDDVIMIDNPGEVTQLSEIAAGPQPSAKIFTDRKELLYWLSTYIWSIDDEECLDKEWVRSTRPYPISLSLRTLRDILDANKPIDCDCFNMGVRTVACNEALLWLDDKFHYMDLQFCSISQFGRDPRRCDKLDYKKLAKLLECWPDMEYDISHCSSVLLPYRQMEHYTLYILDMGTRTVSIMDPHPKNGMFKGSDPCMPYIHKLHNIANNFKLTMELAHPAWKDDIFYWRRKFPTWVPKTTDCNLSGFLVYSFMWSWNGVRLPVINTRSHSLRTNFLVDILKSSENECKDIIPGELQDLLKQIRN